MRYAAALFIAAILAAVAAPAASAAPAAPMPCDSHTLSRLCW
ncbi:hypothetical protein [Streptomyces caeruleatus]|nr:hypothetical protein [Streptomyces caeruleatus]